jgi:hypothetical protein
MGDLVARQAIKTEARKRVAAMAFGEPATNICAGSGNPMRHCWFVQLKGDFACCTDRKGKFFDIGIEVVYPGHLTADERERLFAPVWASQFGPSPSTVSPPHE